jgi:hypothetical protein
MLDAQAVQNSEYAQNLPNRPYRRLDTTMLLLLSNVLPI